MPPCGMRCAGARGVVDALIACVELRNSLCQCCVGSACAQRVEIVDPNSLCQHSRSDRDAALREDRRR